MPDEFGFPSLDDLFGPVPKQKQRNESNSLIDGMPEITGDFANLVGDTANGDVRKIQNNVKPIGNTFEGGAKKIGNRFKKQKERFIVFFERNGVIQKREFHDLGQAGQFAVDMNKRPDVTNVSRPQQL